MVTVAVEVLPSPSRTVYLNLSVPEKSTGGVYVIVLLSLLILTSPPLTGAVALTIVRAAALGSSFSRTSITTGSPATVSASSSTALTPPLSSATSTRTVSASLPSPFIAVIV